jgi:ubiquinone biosynthesis protein
VLQRWMDEQVGARAVIDDLRENLPHVRQALRELPAAIRELSDRASSGNLTFDLHSEEIERMRRELEVQRSQRYWLIVAMTSIISGTLVLTVGGNVLVGGGLLVAGLLGIYSGRPGAG